MNALELADELQAVLFACGKERPFLEHATMLRQQQAENDAVKEANKNLMELVTMLREEVDSLRKAQEK